MRRGDYMTTQNREDSRTAIPQLEKMIKELEKRVEELEKKVKELENE